MAKLITLFDNFNDNTTDTGLWSVTGTPAQVVEQNNQLEITTLTSIGTHGYRSATTYDLTSSQLVVRVVNAGNQALTSLEIHAPRLFIDANNSVSIYIKGNTVYARKVVTGTPTNIANVAYNSATMRYFRIRELSGTTYWQYSADGISWTSITTQANPITMTALSVDLTAGNTSVEASGTTVIFDAVNLMIFQTGNKIPTAVEQSAIASTSAWRYQDQILADDSLGFGDLSAQGNFIAGADSLILRISEMVIAGVIQATNRANDDVVLGSAISYGSAVDLWGATSLLGSDVNKYNFGFTLASGQNSSGVKTTKTYRIIGETYNFALPDNTKILGFIVTHDVYSFASGGGTQTIGLDTIKANAFHNWDIQMSVTGQAGGNVYSTPINRQKPQKRFRYSVFSKDGTFLGEWRDVATEPTFKRQINTGMSSMQIQLDRNEEVRNNAVDDIYTESGPSELLTDEADGGLLADIAAPSGLGAGTDLDTNVYLQVQSFYGQFVELTTEGDEPLLTEDWNMIVAQDGAPEGRTIWTGFVTEWEEDFGTDEGISVSALSHFEELDNIMLQTVDTVQIDNFSGRGSGFLGINGGGPTDFYAQYQTFTANATFDMAGVKVNARCWFSLEPLTVQLQQGTPSVPVGSVLATASINLTPDMVFRDYTLSFNTPVTLTNGVQYFLSFSTTDYKTGGNVTYPVTFASNSGVYASGDNWYRTVDTGLVQNTGVDIAFQIMKAGGATTVPFNSYDPSNILKAVLDYARTRGAIAGYDISTIDNTGTTVSYTFAGATISEAIKKVLELAPADYYWYYHHGENKVYFRKRPTTNTRFYTKGRDVNKLKLKKSISQLINEVYFTGGGTPNLFDKTIDTASQASLRRGLSKLNDNRVTVLSTADILSQSQIDRYKDAIYSGSATVIDRDGNAPLEDVNEGDLTGWLGFSKIIHTLSLQIMSVTYHPESLDFELGFLLPPIEKRVEDIKRNLNTTDTANLPSSPS